MNDCPFQPLLSACHDGELDAAMQRRLRGHLANCPACAAAIGWVDDLSARIASAAANARETEYVNRALARMHRAIDHAAAQRRIKPARVKPASGTVLRLAAPLVAIAASVFIVSGVWLLDTMNSGRPTGIDGVAAIETPESSMVAVAPEWERVATTLRADPRWGVMADSPFAPHYADAIDWMLEGLNLTEEAQWPLRKSF